MKKQKDYTVLAILIVFTLAMLGSLVGTAQCSTRNPAITAALGGNHTGPTLNVEAGSYSSVPLTLSYFGGFQIATREEQETFRESKQSIPRQIQYIDAYGRIALKISGTEGESAFYQFFTVYGSLRKNVGASYRLYRSVQNVLIGIEPNYCRVNGSGINILITGKF